MQRSVSVSVEIVVIANGTALTTMIVVIYDSLLLPIERSDDSATAAAQIKSQCALM